MDLKRICLRCMNGEIGENGTCSVCGSKQLTVQTPTCALPLQTIVHGRYLIGGVLGQGGFGITYAAYDLTEQRRIVIKELYPAFMVRRTPGTTNVIVTKNEDLYLKSRQRFVEEAQLIYTFRATPEIVDVYHIFIENNTGYYTMEYLTGQTLHDLLKNSGAHLTWEQLAPIIRSVINALRVVHHNGSIHRDISPDNIYLPAAGGAKLIDFGAARHYNTGQEMTQILKKGFAPWEQYYSSGKFGPWTDIYALGATIYVCLTGKVPPDAPARAQNDTMLRPSEHGIHVPPHVENAVMQAMHMRPEGRFQTVDAFAGALQLIPNLVPPYVQQNAVQAQQQSRYVPQAYPVQQARPQPSRYAQQQAYPVQQAQPQPPRPAQPQFPRQYTTPPADAQWRLRGIRGRYAGVQFAFTSNIVIGRDPTRCTLVYPIDAPGISAVHVSFLYGSGPSFPGIRCESATQALFINGTMFSGRGRISRLQSGDRITFGDNQIFTVERVK